MKRVRKQFQKGSTLPAVILFLTVIGGLSVGVAGLSHQQGTLSNRSINKGVATELAESGMAQLYDNITKQIQADETYPLNLAPTTMEVTNDGLTRSIGSYTARVTDVQRSESNVGSIVRVTYTFSIEGTGTAPQGQTSTVQTRFTGYLEKRPTAVLGSATDNSNLSVPPGAIVSNNRVIMVTDNGVRTYDRSSHNLADIYAQTGITWLGFRNDKTTIRSGSVISAQGRIAVPSTALAFTASPDGIGNSNGVQNFGSRRIDWDDEDESFSDYYHNTDPGQNDQITSLTTTPRFNTEEEVDSWNSDWVDTVTHDADRHVWERSVQTSDLPWGWAPQCWQHIDSPAHIKGDLNVNAEVHLLPTSDDPTKNIIYVDGNILNSNKIVNHGVQLVVVGSYSDSRGATYTLSNERSYFRSDVGVRSQASLISLKRDATAITLNSVNGSSMGLVYRTKGGIVVNGTGELGGKLAAGGQGELGNIEIRPRGGGTLSVMYDRLAEKKRPAFKGTTTTTTTTAGSYVITKPFSASNLSNWQQTK